jgi:hypothetical protein
LVTTKWCRPERRRQLPPPARQTGKAEKNVVAVNSPGLPFPICAKPCDFFDFSVSNETGLGVQDESDTRPNVQRNAIEFWSVQMVQIILRRSEVERPTGYGGHRFTSV